MKTRMNPRFAEFWQDASLDDDLTGIVLMPRLEEVVRADLVRTAGCVFLAPLYDEAARSASIRALKDETGCEAFVNKLHVEDYLGSDVEPTREGVRALVCQGAKAAAVLAERLDREGPYRVLLSLEPQWPSMVLRFFCRRKGQPWGPDDVSELSQEGLLIIDTGGAGFGEVGG